MEEQLSCRGCFLLRGWFEKGRRRICGNSSSGDLISYLSDWKAAARSWSWSSVKAINPPYLVVCASIFCVREVKKMLFQYNILNITSIKQDNGY